MWLSKQIKPYIPTSDADLGVTSIAGDQPGVVTRGEVRALPVYGPGGYIWLPKSGAAVLVIKGGPGGEEQCVTGTKQPSAPEGMQPGEIFLYGPADNSIYLRADGSIELNAATISIQGALLINGIPYRPCWC